MNRAEKNKLYLKKHYRNNKQYYLDRNAKRREEIRRFIALLKNKPCMDCGKSFPLYVMDFDHRDSEIKEFDIGKAINRMYGKERITKEIEKCDLVCANCHRIRTYR